MNDIEYVKDIFVSKGYELIDKEYKGSLYKYSGKDVNGYLIYTQYNNLLVNGRAKVFYKTNPYTIQNIHTWLELEEVDLKLLSDCYVGADEYLEWIDKKETLPLFKTTWRSVLDGSRHPMKARDSVRPGGAKYPMKFDDGAKLNGRALVIQTVNTKLKQWEIVDIDNFKYQNSSQKIKLINKQGYYSEMSIWSILKGTKPSIFTTYQPEISLNNVKNWLNLNTPYSLKDNQQYTGTKNRYTLICPKHGEFKPYLNHLLSGVTKCYQCKLEENREKNNINDQYRNSPEYKKWRMNVFIRDEYTCQCCGQVGYKLNVHHLYSYRQYESLRLKENNGVTLCEECHHDFHSIYGKINNTNEEFVKWINLKVGI